MTYIEDNSYTNIYDVKVQCSKCTRWFPERTPGSASVVSVRSLTNYGKVYPLSDEIPDIHPTEHICPTCNHRCH